MDDVPLRIGCAAGFSGDRTDAAAPVVDALVAGGGPAVLIFETLAERTLALAQLARRLDDDAGFEPLLADLLRPVLERCLRHRIRIVSNFGAANPQGAARRIAALARELGLPEPRIAVVAGDDLSAEACRPLLAGALKDVSDSAEVTRTMVCANAYIGAEPIVDCLREDAQIVLGGRLADPSLFVGPICHELGWSLDDWEAVGHATLVGHLLECGVHSTGGNFEDPPYRVVPDPHRLGFPLAEVSEDSAVVTKLDGTGGAVDERTMKTQLYYEIHDPRTYLTPDVTADFSQVRVEDLGGDRVRLSGATGREWPATLKVLVGVDQGYRATGEISYGGPGCLERARRAEEILRAHLDELLDPGDQVRIDLQGMNSLFGDKEGTAYPEEVRLRLAVRTESEELARDAAHEVELLYFGPAGGGGVVTSVVPALGVTPAYVPRELVTLETEVVTS